MKILIVSHEYPPVGGGGANACYFLSREYAAQGHEVTVLTAQFHGNPQDEMINGVHIHRVDVKRKKQEKSNLLEMGFFLMKAWKKAEKLQEQYQFDISQIFFGIPSGPVGLHLKRKYQLPYIVRFGGGDIPGAQKRYALLYKVLNPFLRNIWKNASGLVANSEGLQLRAERFEDKYPIACIANGVDTEFFHPAESKNMQDVEAPEMEIKSKDITVLFVSRLIEGKGLQDIIPHLQKISEASGRKVLLQIVGDGPYRENLEALTRETHMEQYVTFEGRKNKQELLSYYGSADFFILPSRSEGMPNVVLEAMAMGLPIIMTPCEGSKELIHENGYIAPIDQFIERMITMCKDKQLRNQFGRRSMELIQSEFTWSDKAKQYISLMENCVE
ncbi:MAG: glycosyltransferase family 4 protein [Lachnospiraceae bacterium]|nr:glycosyltransferase family 4 protein [Lachnospiraceae bacterium]